MRRLEGTWVIATHSSARRRVIDGRCFWGELLRGRPFWHKRGARRRANAVHEISPADFPVHSKLAIVGFHSGFLSCRVAAKRFRKIALFQQCCQATSGLVP
jgi:hypothetical protein